MSINNNKKKAIGVVMTLLAIAFLGACSEQEAASKPLVELKSVELSIENVRADIQILASDDFGGRGPLSEGETKTINYLADEYRKAGLKPGVNGSYLQKVAMAKLTPDLNMKLEISGSEGISLSFKAGREFTARTKQIQSQIDINASELIFVGYGINAPEYEWNDYADIDVKGKIVVMLVNDPGFATQDEALFTGNAMTYYGRWTYKYEEAARQGASAVLIVHETASAGYPWSVVESSNTGAKFTLVDDDANSSLVPVMGWIQQAVAETIIASAGADYAVLKSEAMVRGFKARSLNLEAQLTLKSAIEQAESNNVVAVLPGIADKNHGQADEYIVLSAHWDHYGTKQTEAGTQIFNGAVDNATGTAATLELARYFAKAAPLKRSLLFVNFTAEETGMIGSEMFAAGGVVPTKDMVAALNIDGMNPLDGVDYILQYGKGLSDMEAYLAAAANGQGRHVKMDPRPQNGLFFRSDHFMLAKQGVPSLLFMSLGDTDPDYIINKYHKEADDYSAAWSMAGIEQDMALIRDITAKLADSSDWPTWLAESDFKKRRALDGRH